jgi:hypothetical protein
MTTDPDYKELFEKAIYHLRVLSGSRNSFSVEARERLLDPKLPSINFRTPEVEQMHGEAREFLKQYDK